MNNVKSGDRTDSVNSLLYLAIEHMPKECKVTAKKGACQTLFVLFMDGRYLAWFIHLRLAISMRLNVICISFNMCLFHVNHY